VTRTCKAPTPSLGGTSLRSLLSSGPTASVLGASLALQVHLMSNAPLDVWPSELRAFDELEGALSGDSVWSTPDSSPQLQDVVLAICQVVKAFHVSNECNTILPHALILIERFVCKRGLPLRPHVFRPILIAAVSLASKQYFDESLEMHFHVRILRSIGLSQLDGMRMFELEMSLAESVDWELAMTRELYHIYAFEMKSLCMRFRGIYQLAISVDTALSDGDAPQPQQTRPDDEKTERKLPCSTLATAPPRVRRVRGRRVQHPSSCAKDDTAR